MNLVLTCALWALYHIYLTNGQFAICDDIFQLPLTESVCNSTTPDSGECCTCANQACEGCVPTLCPSDPPTSDPTSEPTSDPTTSSPSTDPTNNPTTDPSSNPTSDPTAYPTIDPTGDPTNDPTDDPTADPTNDPTSDPTSDPTIDPTTNPTKDPTSNPTSDPTIDPSSNPTNDPTIDPIIDPSIDPTSDPTRYPTIDPTMDPTIDPTTDPVSNPTNDPTIDPVADPTNDPTTDPTVDPTSDPLIDISSTITFVECPDCPFNVTMSGIGNVTIVECPTVEETPTPTSGWPKKSSSKKKKSGGRHRRRLGGGYGYQPKKSYGGHSKKTPSPTPWMADRVCIETEENRRRLYGYRPHEEDDGCDKKKKKDNGFDEWYKEKCNLNDYKQGYDHSYKSAYDSDDDSSYGRKYTSWGTRVSKPDEFLSEVCVTYSVSGMQPSTDCDGIQSVFLGICENNGTTFNSSMLTADDLTSIIVSVTGDGTIVDAYGSEVDGSLGIIVEFSNTSKVTTFELCLGNVTVDSSFNQDRDLIDIGAGQIELYDEFACAADGLPCLNFFFDIPCPPTTTEYVSLCDCEGLLTSLTLRYEPENNLSANIIGYYNANQDDTVLCSFLDVQPGQEIVCSSTTFNTLYYKTVFTVEYIDESGTRRRRRRLGGGSSKKKKKKGGGSTIDRQDCYGTFGTKCHSVVVGQASDNCDDIIAIGYTSDDGAICDEAEALSAQSANALVDGESGIIESPLQTLQNLDPFVRYSLIGLVVAFTGLSLVACYICVVRRNKEQNDARMTPIADVIHYGSQKNINAATMEYTDDEDQEHLVEMGGITQMK